MLDRIYEAAVITLRGWSDTDIMECDLRRLRFAIDKVDASIGEEWRIRWRIGGFKIDDPVDDLEDDEAFNAQLRATVGIFKKSP